MRDDTWHCHSQSFVKIDDGLAVFQQGIHELGRNQGGERPCPDAWRIGSGSYLGARTGLPTDALALAAYC